MRAPWRGEPTRQRRRMNQLAGADANEAQRASDAGASLMSPAAMALTRVEILKKRTIDYLQVGHSTVGEFRFRKISLEKIE